MRMSGSEVARWENARRRRPDGYTLIEILVVLIVMGLVTALVAPALIPHTDAKEALPTLIEQARVVAIRRAETVSLRIEASGAWQIDGIASPQQGALAHGRLPQPPATAVTLLFSPLGTCGPDVTSTAGVQALGVDLLTCATPAQ